MAVAIGWSLTTGALLIKMWCEKLGERTVTGSKGLAKESFLQQLCRIKVGKSLEQVVFIEIELFGLLAKVQDKKLPFVILLITHSADFLSYYKAQDTRSLITVKVVLKTCQRAHFKFTCLIKCVSWLFCLVCSGIFFSTWLLHISLHGIECPQQYCRKKRTQNIPYTSHCRKMT